MSIPVDLGAGTGNTAQNLRPRQHIDELSEYYFKLIFKYKNMLKSQIFIFSFVLEFPFLLYELHYYLRFCFSFVFALCFTEKQRINSGFFLFKAEQMKKAEQKEFKKNMKTIAGLIGIVWRWFSISSFIYFLLALFDKILLHTIIVISYTFRLEWVITGLLNYSHW